MNKIKYVLPIAILPLALTSCGSRINRVVFKEIEYANASNIHSNIKNSQTKDAISTLFSNGSIEFKYSVSTKGSARIDGMSLHDINFSASSSYNLGWDFNETYFKLKGEKENEYFVYDKENKKYWQCGDYIVDNQHSKIRYDVTNDVNKCGGFKNYVTEQINYYCSIEIPFFVLLTAGITGDVTEGIETENRSFSPDYLFDKTFHDLIEGYNKIEGNNLALTYGSNDESSVCGAIKGKINSSSIKQDNSKGSFNVDVFASFKNNFISQFELIVDGKTTNLTKNNLSLDIKAYMAEEVKENSCKPDSININDFPEEK